MSLFVTVSGSFKRHLGAIQDAVATLVDDGSIVLSPADPRIVDAFGDFVFVSSDLRRSIKGIQNRHLDAIRHSDLLWLVCPDGYVGQSAAMEVGFAVADGVPVFSDAPPSDWTLRQYVTPVGNVTSAIRAIEGSLSATTRQIQPSLLLAPEVTLAIAHDDLNRVGNLLLHDRGYKAGDPIEESVARIRRVLTLPSAT